MYEDFGRISTDRVFSLLAKLYLPTGSRQIPPTTPSRCGRPSPCGARRRVRVPGIPERHRSVRDSRAPSPKAAWFHVVSCNSSRRRRVGLPVINIPEPTLSITDRPDRAIALWETRCGKRHPHSIRETGGGDGRAERPSHPGSAGNLLDARKQKHFACRFPCRRHHEHQHFPRGISLIFSFAIMIGAVYTSHINTQFRDGSFFRHPTDHSSAGTGLRRIYLWPVAT